MYALVDCNNFFVSCERVFNPNLCKKPVVVLSSNDGCVIARSNEVKEMGIPMGAPAYKYKELFEKEGIIALSCNHALYHDMSQRVMALLSERVGEIQIYSVDEAFFKIDETDIILIQKFASELVQYIERCTGISISIGVSYTRTLSKIASHIAKKERNNSPKSYILYSPDEIHKRLKVLPVRDVWGIGHQINLALAKINVYTAFEFSRLPRLWVKKHFTIVGERTWLELHGLESCEIQSVTAERKSLTVSRTFGNKVTDKTQLKEATSTLVSQCAVKLRKENKMVKAITIFISTSRFNENDSYYSNSSFCRLQYCTNSTMELVKLACELLDRIYRDGYAYKRAGVLLSELGSADSYQYELFNEIDEAKHQKLMSAIDQINNMGLKSKVFLCAEGTDKKIWMPKSLHSSKHFSTSIKDSIIVKA